MREREDWAGRIFWGWGLVFGILRVFRVVKDLNDFKDFKDLRDFRNFKVPPGLSVLSELHLVFGAELLGEGVDFVADILLLTALTCGRAAD